MEATESVYRLQTTASGTHSSNGSDCLLDQTDFIIQHLLKVRLQMEASHPTRIHLEDHTTSIIFLLIFLTSGEEVVDFIK